MKALTICTYKDKLHADFKLKSRDRGRVVDARKLGSIRVRTKSDLEKKFAPEIHI